MEQIKFIFKRSLHLLIAVLALISIVFGLLATSFGSTSAKRDEYEARSALFRDLWGKQIEVEIVEAVIDLSQGFPTGIIAKVRNNSSYPIDDAKIACKYFVSTASFEAKVRNGVEVLEPSNAPRGYMARSSEEFYRIEPGKTAVLNFKAGFAGTTGINTVADLLQRVKLDHCFGFAGINQYDAIRIAFQEPLR